MRWGGREGRGWDGMEGNGMGLDRGGCDVMGQDGARWDEVK